MAPKTNAQRVSEFQSFIPYIQSLEALDNTVWESPVGDGKWSLKELVCHLMRWDQYFYEEAFAKVKEGQPVTSRHLNFNEFNARAIQYAQTVTVQEAIQQFVLYRSLIVAEMTGSSEEDFCGRIRTVTVKRSATAGICAAFSPTISTTRSRWSSISGPRWYQKANLSPPAILNCTLYI